MARIPPSVDRRSLQRPKSLVVDLTSLSSIICRITTNPCIPSIHLTRLITGHRKHLESPGQPNPPKGLLFSVYSPRPSHSVRSPEANQSTSRGIAPIEGAHQCVLPYRMHPFRVKTRKGSAPSATRTESDSSLTQLSNITRNNYRTSHTLHKKFKRMD